MLISADETEPLAIRLLAGGGIASGRVVDRSGVPVADVSIEFCPKVPEIHVGSGTWIAQSDDSGRFEISSLIDGMEYALFSKGRDRVFRPLKAEPVSVRSGQSENLGDIHISDRMGN